MGERETFRERNKTQLSCTECVVMVAASYLKINMEQIHAICVTHMRVFDEVGIGIELKKKLVPW